MDSEKVGSELRAIRNRLGLSLKDVENSSGIYAQTLSDYENNKVNIKVCTLEKILNVYNTNLFIFFKTLYEYTHNNSDLIKELEESEV